MIHERIQSELMTICQKELNKIFGETVQLDIIENYFKGKFLFNIHFTPEMLSDLMDNYVLSRKDMAMCMGSSIDCFDILLRLKKSLPKMFNTRIGYATIILILGSSKYGTGRFLKWYRYYLQKHNLAYLKEYYRYVELIKLLSLESQVSISYYWKELEPNRVIELPSCFHSKHEG